MFRVLLKFLQSIFNLYSIYIQQKFNETSVTANLQSTVVSFGHYTGVSFSKASLTLQDIAVHASHQKKQKGIPDTTGDTRRYQSLQGTVARSLILQERVGDP